VTPALSDYCDAINSGFRRKKRFSSYKATAALVILTALVISGTDWAWSYVRNIIASYETEISALRKSSEEIEKERVEKIKETISDAVLVNKDKGSSRADIYINQIKFGLRPTKYERVNGGLVYQDQTFLFEDAMFWENVDLINLIVESKMLPFEDKAYFLRNLDRMDNDKIDKLYSILYQELEKYISIGLRDFKARVDRALSEEQPLTPSFANMMIAYAKDALKFGDFSEPDYNNFINRVEIRIRESARTSYSMLDSYKNVFLEINNISSGEEKLKAYQKYVSVLVPAYENGLISEHQVSEQVQRFSWKAIISGDYLLAEKICREWLKVKPDDRAVVEYLVQSLAMQGKQFKRNF